VLRGKQAPGLLVVSRLTVALTVSQVLTKLLSCIRIDDGLWLIFGNEEDILILLFLLALEEHIKKDSTTGEEDIFVHGGPLFEAVEKGLLSFA
jgi:hypothetical protein